MPAEVPALVQIAETLVATTARPISIPVLRTLVATEDNPTEQPEFNKHGLPIRRDGSSS